MRCRSSCAAGCRAACRSTSTTSTPWRPARRSTASASAGTMVEQGGVRHAFKMQADWQIPVGRGKRFGRDMHPVLNGIIGGWSINGVGRVQQRVLNLGSVRLVGMTLDDLQEMYKVLLPAERDERAHGSVDAARGRHPEHPPGVQRVDHDARRVLHEPRAAAGPVHRAGEHEGLPADQGRRLRRVAHQLPERPLVRRGSTSASPSDSTSEGR